MAGKSALIIGASRGLGYALAAEFLRRGWQVTATERTPSALHELAGSAEGRLTVETVDIAVPGQVSALRERLAGSAFDLLFVNAGTNYTTDPAATFADVSTEDFVQVMVTNALSPMRAVETLRDLVPATGTIGVMSSGQGSVADNTNGGFEVYRASKSALNQLMRSYAARHADDPRTLLLMAPGWVKTDLGGPRARLTIDESIPGVADTIEAWAGKGGLHYLDRQGQTVNW
ncbi:SDR family NAD(P)-dependent oxidoreductase [Amycolatopsis echigonensis]|uniref:SDR family NAD(P)-dependent oxidoreductase n=1 Tax=Amycolatopsis echigonensis TaxID=2576905 RepID=A0A8E2B0X6_9PSEU|nr:SDR family NAD(P)-dependent oxidoreductase [Amycolatopsis echigonensis]MBB2499321.1 SDR family NAD(P)-dependent oxidoreductase [Amycolatopsis echigonensis]